MSSLSISAAKASSSLLKLIGRGGSMPGSIALKVDPQSLRKLKIDGPVILVTGTNGKTSTSNLITSAFEQAGKTVVSNRKGDNLREGITTALLTNADSFGKVKADVVVLEVDELNIRHILPALPISALVVNNFFRDQLDRAREMEQLIETIENVLPSYAGKLILNGNDPNVVRLALKASKAEKVYFGLAKNASCKEKSSEASEGKFCPKCGHALHYDYYQYSHIGKFHCPNCDFKTPDLNTELKDINIDANTFSWKGRTFKAPYEGLYSMYNYAALAAVLEQFDLDPSVMEKVFAHAPRPAGRNETFHDEKNERDIILNLIKNPTGANEVLKVIERDPDDKSVIIVLNDNDQDGTDVSWIYDAQFEKLVNPSIPTIITTGTRGNDMALRMFYTGYEADLSASENIEQALHSDHLKGKNIYVIATYTALVPSRQAILKAVGK